MIRLPTFLPCPSDTLPDGEIRIASGGGIAGFSATEQLGPYDREGAILTDDRFWVVPLVLWAETKFTIAESEGCSFFSESPDWPESIGGAAEGEGKHYSAMELTYESLVTPGGNGTPYTETTTQNQTLNHSVTAEGLEVCELVSDPEELPDPPTDGLPWTLSAVSFSRELAERHRFDWALEVAQVLHDLGTVWIRQSHVNVVMDGPAVESNGESTAGVLSIRFVLATESGENVPFPHGADVGFSFSKEDRDTFEVSYEDFSVTVPEIPEGASFGDPSEITTVFTGFFERLQISGPVVNLFGSTPYRSSEMESVLTTRAGVLPALQTAENWKTRFRNAESTGEDPRNPSLQVPISYTGTLEVSRNVDDEWEVSRTGAVQNLTPPVLFGVELAPIDVLSAFGFPAASFPLDVDSRTLPTKTYAEMQYLQEGVRKWREGDTKRSERHWHQIDLSSPDVGDLESLAESIRSDGTGDSAANGLGYAAAALFSPDNGLSHLRARSWMPVTELGLLWYRAYDDAGIVVGRRMILPNGPIGDSETIVTLHGQTIDSRGESQGEFELVLDQTDPEKEGFGAWLEATAETAKIAETATVEWPESTGRLAFPLALAPGASL